MKFKLFFIMLLLILIQIIPVFSNSIGDINHAYMRVYGHKAPSSELNYWRVELKSGRTINEIENRLILRKIEDSSIDLSKFPPFDLDSFLKKNYKNKIVIYGDTRTNQDIHAKVLEAISKIKPVYIFHTGDVEEHASNPQVYDFIKSKIFKIVKKDNFFLCTGNHEGESQNYYTSFQLPGNEKWYNVDIDDMRFIIVDTNIKLNKGSLQYRWLEKKLAEPGFKYKIMVFHEPPFSSGKHGSTKKLANLPQLFEKYKVSAVFNGHDHDYERIEKNGIKYIVTGGGGAPLRNKRFNLSCSKKFLKTYHFCVLYKENGQLHVDVITPDMKLIDQFIIE